MRPRRRGHLGRVFLKAPCPDGKGPTLGGSRRHFFTRMCSERSSEHDPGDNWRRAPPCGSPAALASANSCQWTGRCRGGRRPAWARGPPILARIVFRTSFETRPSKKMAVVTSWCRQDVPSWRHLPSPLQIGLDGWGGWKSMKGKEIPKVSIIASAWNGYEGRIM